jgi:hypothetical protein|tara:strand:+ start:100 stop:477 length:378 start_codon:yes stop_codon:yes gene_type:complete
MLTFKQQSDLGRWRSGLSGGDPAEIGPPQARDWIASFNALSEHHTGKSAVVTSWYRDDRTAHRGGHAVDFRRLSGANARFPKYTAQDVEALETAAVGAGIPIVVIKRGTPSEHWHCGEIATLAHE